jgi:hypothetical protein
MEQSASDYRCQPGGKRSNTTTTRRSGPPNALFWVDAGDVTRPLPKSLHRIDHRAALVVEPLEQREPEPDLVVRQAAGVKADIRRLRLHPQNLRRAPLAPKPSGLAHREHGGARSPAVNPRDGAARHRDPLANGSTEAHEDDSRDAHEEDSADPRDGDSDGDSTDAADCDASNRDAEVPSSDGDAASDRNAA